MKIREEVAWFVERMEEKMSKHDSDRGDGWKEKDITLLTGRVWEELQELRDIIAELEDEDEEKVVSAIYECADVANFAMMVANNLRSDLPKTHRLMTDGKP